VNRLGALLAIGAATVLLGTALAPASASAEEGEAEETSVVTTELHPGWNMVGWLGPETPVSELFTDMPAIREVRAWDSIDQRYNGASRDGPDELHTLTPGLGLWLYLGGDAPVTWQRPVAPGQVWLTLSTGSNLVAWPGESPPARETLGRLGASLVLAARWNAELQRFELHTPGTPDSINPLTTVRSGEAIWLLVADGEPWRVLGPEQPRFEFAAGITPEERESVFRRVGSVVAYFAEQFGVVSTDFTLSVGTVPGCALNRTVIWTGVTSVECVARSYFRTLVWQLSEGASLGPDWMTEGPHRYAEALYMESVREEGDERTGYDRARRFAIFGSLGSPRLDEPPGTAAGGEYGDLGFLATEWLVDRFGPEAFMDYYRRLPSSPDWEGAFEAAFGVSIDDFYTAFEAHRAEVAPQAPHVADPAVRPAIRFLGNIPEETRSAIQGELDSVTAFFTDYLGGEPIEYSIYVARDAAAARATHNRLSPPGIERQICSGGVHVLDCPRFSLSYRYHVAIQHRHRTLNTTDGNAPTWLTFSRDYLERRFLAVTGVWDSQGYDRALRPLARRVKQSSVPLPQLESGEGWRAAGLHEREALALVALDWLGKHSGDAALIDYYRLLPRGTPSHYWYEPNAGSWQAAFEQAFGLTVEEFYEAFAAYREALPAN
jgi:hypothetical protein